MQAIAKRFFLSAFFLFVGMSAMVRGEVTDATAQRAERVKFALQKVKSTKVKPEVLVFLKYLNDHPPTPWEEIVKAVSDPVLVKANDFLFYYMDPENPESRQEVPTPGEGYFFKNAPYKIHLASASQPFSEVKWSISEEGVLLLTYLELHPELVEGAAVASSPTPPAKENAPKVDSSKSEFLTGMETWEKNLLAKESRWLEEGKQIFVVKQRAEIESWRQSQLKISPEKKLTASQEAKYTLVVKKLAQLEALLEEEFKARKDYIQKLKQYYVSNFTPANNNMLSLTEAVEKVWPQELNRRRVMTKVIRDLAAAPTGEAPHAHSVDELDGQ